MLLRILNTWLLAVPLITISLASGSRCLDAEGRAPGASGVDTDQAVAQAVARCIETDVTSALILDLATRLGDGVVESLFEEFAASSEGGNKSAAAVRAFESSMRAIPGIVLESAERSEVHRATGLRVLARRGTRRDIKSAFDLSASQAGAPAATPTLDALEVALLGIFERFPADVDQVRSSLNVIDGAQIVRLIRALGQHGRTGPYGSDRAFTLLGDMLLGNEIYRSMILAQMGRLTLSRPDGGAIVRVRNMLHATAPAIQREAVLTLGKLKDIDSFGELVDLLEHDDERMRSNAHWSLKHISGRTFRSDPRQWEAWHAAENEWWNERSPELFEQLASIHAGEIASALNELATHQLFRHAIAEAVRPLLSNRRNDIVLLSCATAFSLGSAAAIPELIEALEHRDPRIQASALRALTSITGIDLPADRNAWRQALPH